MRFVKILLSAISALGFTFASGAYADPPSVAGRLSYLSGPVSFAPGDAPEEWVAATLNRPITVGDRLWAADNAVAEVRVGSLAMRMAELTAVDVLALDDRAFQLRVPQGNVQLRVRRLPADRLIEIATPTASVVVRRPGSYRISVDPSGAMIAVARAGGEAEVYTAESSFVVRDNEEVSIAGGRPEMYGAPALDEFDRWAENRDGREAGIAATRYVPIEMTGYEDLDSYGQWRTVATYGAVWVPTGMQSDWAPYRYGHWVWISPWGWTWVDEAPWGFAPFHYGRWLWLDNYWAWAPGRIVERPVYSPAMVAFVGGADFAVSLGLGAAAVGWVPLAWGEPYIPWYSASPTYLRNVNVTQVTNVTNINVANIRYVNRRAPAAVTVVSRENFVAARPVGRAAIRVPERVVATAPVMRTSPVTEPARTSFVRSQPGSRPPAQVVSREAVVVNRPPALRREGPSQAPRVAAAEQRPPVRVIDRRERVNIPVAPSAEARRPQMQAPRVMAPADQPRAPQTVQEQQTREQRGEREREQQRKQEDQQKAQAQQQAGQLERERRQAEQQKQRAPQEADRQQRAVQEQQRQEQDRRQRAQQEQQKAQQQQRQATEQQQRTAQEQQRQEQDRRQRAQQEQQKAQQQQRQATEQQQQRTAQEQQRQEQDRRQRAQEEQQKAQQQQRQATEQQQRAVQEQQRQEQDRRQRAQEEQQKAQQQQRAQQEKGRQAAEQQQKAREQEARQQQERQQQEEQQRQRAREQQSRQQEEMRQRQQQQAQQEQQRAREQQARQQAEQQRAQQEQQRAREQQARQQQELKQRQAEQQKAQEQQRAAQQAAQQRAQQEQQQRAQQAAQAQQRAREQEARQQAQAQRAQQAAAEQRAREAQAPRPQPQQAAQPARGQAQEPQGAAEKGEKGRRPNQD